MGNLTWHRKLLDWLATPARHLPLESRHRGHHIIIRKASSQEPAISWVYGNRHCWPLDQQFFKSSTSQWIDSAIEMVGARQDLKNINVGSSREAVGAAAKPRAAGPRPRVRLHRALYDTSTISQVLSDFDAVRRTHPSSALRPADSGVVYQRGSRWPSMPNVVRCRGWNRPTGTAEQVQRRGCRRRSLADVPVPSSCKTPALHQVVVW